MLNWRKQRQDSSNIALIQPSTIQPSRSAPFIICVSLARLPHARPVPLPVVCSRQLLVPLRLVACSALSRLALSYPLLGPRRSAPSTTRPVLARPSLALLFPFMDRLRSSMFPWHVLTRRDHNTKKTWQSKDLTRWPRSFVVTFVGRVPLLQRKCISKYRVSPQQSTITAYLRSFSSGPSFFIIRFFSSGRPETLQQPFLISTLLCDQGQPLARRKHENTINKINNNQKGLPAAALGT